MILVPPSREIVLSTVAQAVYSGENPALRIRDTSLIEPSIQTIRELVQRARGENTRLVFINSLDGKNYSEELLSLTLYVEYGVKALVLLPEEPVHLPEQACRLVGEHCDWINYLDYDPPSYI